MNTTAIPTPFTVEELKACKLRLDDIYHIWINDDLDEFDCAAVLSRNGFDLVTMTLVATIGRYDSYIDIEEAQIVAWNCEPESTADPDLQSALTAACLEALETGHLADILSKLKRFTPHIAAADA